MQLIPASCLCLHLVAACLLIVASSDIPITPFTGLVPKGATTKVRCPIGAPSRGVDWAKVIPGTHSASARYHRIVVDCAVLSESLYDVDVDVTTGHCDLVLRNAGSEHGGRYVCYDASDHMSDEASISVIETNVTGSQTSLLAVGGDVVNFTCEIHYHGSTSPSLRWPASRELSKETDVTTATGDWQQTSMSVRIPDGPATVRRTCRVADWDQNWSSVYFWQSAVINVSYCRENAQVRGAYEGQSVAVGKVVTCTADSHPPSTYVWFNAMDNTTVDGPTFTVSSRMLFNLTCTATSILTHADGRITTCTSQFSVNFDGFGVSCARVATTTSIGLIVLVLALVAFSSN